MEGGGSNSQLTIFQHIPKTAGSTLHNIFHRYYKKSSIYNIFAGDLSDPSIMELESQPEDKKENIRLLKGHLPFGVHRKFSIPFRYITFLREPIARVISQYFYIKVNEQNPFHYQIVNNDWTVGDFVRSGISEGMNNGQVRWLIGGIHDLKFNEIGDEHYKKAIDNLSKYYIFVGINEMFDESLILLKEKLSWEKTPYYKKQNVNKKNFKKNVTEDDIEIIKSYNKYDIALYDYAIKTLFLEMDKINEFSSELNKFRKKNMIYQLISKPLGIFKK